MLQRCLDMAFQGIGGAALSGQFQTTAGISGPNIAPSTGATRFSDAIASGSDAGSVMVYQWSQQTLSQPVFCQPWREGWQKDFREGALMFNCKNAQYHGVNAPMEALASLPLLNYYLDLSSNRDSSASGRSELENRHYLLGRTVEEVLKNYSFVGCMRNELAVTEKMVYEPYGPAHQRLLNIDYGGFTKIPNIFGTDVCRGDVLYLAIRKGTGLPSCIVDPRRQNKSDRLSRTGVTLQVEGAISRGGGEIMPYTKNDQYTNAFCMHSDVDTEDEWTVECKEHQVSFKAISPTHGYPVIVEDIADSWAEHEQRRAEIGHQYGGVTVDSIPGSESEYNTLKASTCFRLQRPFYIRLGVVKDTAPNPSVSAIQRAIRDTRAMDHLPRLGVLMGV